MAIGDQAVFVPVEQETLPLGFVVTTSGRVSGVRHPGDEPVDKSPFSQEQRVRMDHALTEATRRTGILWTIYIGKLSATPAAAAREMLSLVSDPARTVLIAVSPNEKQIEVLGGDAIGNRFNDRVAQLGVSAALASFKQNDLIDGLVSAVRVMSAAVRPVAI